MKNLKKLIGDRDLTHKLLDQISDEITNLGDQTLSESVENYRSKKRFSKE